MSKELNELQHTIEVASALIARLQEENKRLRNDNKAAGGDTLVCVWTGDEQYWHSNCDSSDEFLETENFKYCPSCGKPIKFTEAEE